MKSNQPSIAVESVASAFPPKKFSQADVQKLLGVENPVVKRLLEAPHIQSRNLLLDAEPGATEEMAPESLADLNRRFHRGIATMGLDAARDAMAKAGVDAADVGVIVAVTSSGLALPGISAMLIRDLGVSRRAHRADLVGMGCNAGVSGVRAACQMLAGRPAGTIGLLLCIEVSSALYVRNESVGTGIVNSLFGDGAVALVLRRSDTAPLALRRPASTTTIDENKSLPGSSRALTDAALEELTVHASPASEAVAPKLHLQDFESATFPELFDDMRYDVDEAQQLYNFKLSKRIPEAVGEAVVEPVMELLTRAKLQPRDVQHWIVHSGGAAVIAGVTKNLGLAEDALRHTVSVLRDFGNLSSGSVLVSYERLLSEHAELGATVRPGDVAVMLGMGPGATIEAALGTFA